MHSHLGRGVSRQSETTLHLNGQARECNTAREARAVRVRGVPGHAFYEQCEHNFEPLAHFDSSSSVRSRRRPNRNGPPSKNLWCA